MAEGKKDSLCPEVVQNRKLGKIENPTPKPVMCPPLVVLSNEPTSFWTVSSGGQCTTLTRSGKFGLLLGGLPAAYR
jgi:hypothetical protein